MQNIDHKLDWCIKALLALTRAHFYNPCTEFFPLRSYYMFRRCHLQREYTEISLKITALSVLQ